MRTKSHNKLVEILNEAKRKPPRERKKIAQRHGMSLATLDRKLRSFKLKGDEGLRRKRRSDKGKPRKLSAKWVNLACAAFLGKPPLNYRQAHNEVLRRCREWGAEPPSYTWTHRWVSATFREAMKSALLKKFPMTLRITRNGVVYEDD